MSRGSAENIYDETLSVFEAGDDPYEPLTTPEVADALGCARRTVYKRLQTLVERGELKTKKTGANSRVWWQSPVSSETDIVSTDGEKRDQTETVQRRVDLFEDVGDIANVGVWEYDITADQSWWTKEVSRIHGLPLDYVAPPEESIEYYHPDDRDTIREAFQRAIEEQEPYDLELRLIDANDQLHWVRTRGEPQFENGELTRVHGTLQDITDRKERERKLERLRTLRADIERLGDIGAWEYNTDTGELYWTEGTYRIHELDDEFEPTVERAVEFYHPDDRKRIRGAVRACIQAGESYSLELRLTTANDNKRWIYTCGDAIDQDGTRVIRGYIQDITDYKKREQKLERLTDEYEAIFEHTTDQLMLIDVEWTDDEPTFRYVRANPANLEETGLEREALEGKTPIEAVGPEMGSELRENYLRCLEAGETIRYEEKIDLPNQVYSDTRLTPIWTDGKITRIVASGRDITQQKKREQQLEQYRILTETAADVIVTTDPDGVILEVNQAVAKVFGYDPDQLRGESIERLIPNHQNEMNWTTIQCSMQHADIQSDLEYVELTGQCADGTEIPLAVSFSEYEHEGQQYFAGIIRDITPRQERDQLRRLEQLNSVIRTIGKTVAQANTREEIAQTVCDTLLEFDHYQLAVIGDYSLSFDHFEQWAWASTDEKSVDIDVDIGVDGDTGPPLGERFGVAAAQSGELQVCQEIDDFPAGLSHGMIGENTIKSCVTIPLVHGNTVYGVIGVYADRPESFDEQQRAVLSELGEIVGYALSALERKEVLDRVVEMELRSEQIAQWFSGGTDDPIQFELDSVVSHATETQLEYWTINNIKASKYQATVEDCLDVQETRLLSTVGNTSRVELTTNSASVASILSNAGGELKSITITDDEARLVAELPETADTDAISRDLRESIPDIEPTARRRILTPTYLHRLTENHLTDRQLTVLRTAYFAGYFDQPRLSTGNDIAERLDITKQTFHHHLRKAEHGVFQQLFETSKKPP